MYLLRLDDASEYMDITNWARVEGLLDKFKIRPIVGIIPNNQDKDLINKYKQDIDFWGKARTWQSKQWTIALHGYNHVHSSKSGGINPVNLRSEFAGLNLEGQKLKIARGVKILNEKGFDIHTFFAPLHTFDMNTLKALLIESEIRIIIDTIADDIYKTGSFYFIPQQAGRVRKLPFKTTVFCYHPNEMKEKDFKKLEEFLLRNRTRFGCFEDLDFIARKFSLYDQLLRSMYFFFRRIRSNLRGVKKWVNR